MQPSQLIHKYRSLLELQEVVYEELQEAKLELEAGGDILDESVALLKLEKLERAIELLGYLDVVLTDYNNL